MADKTYLGLLNGAFIADASPKVQALAGGALMTIPGWAMVFDFIAKGFGAVAAVCGAIIGVRGVYKIFRR